MEPTIYLVQTPLGYQLSAYPHEAGLDEEVSADFLMAEEAYRQYLTQLGGESVYLNEETDRWSPLPDCSKKDPSWMVITYFKEAKQAEYAAQSLAAGL